MQKVLEYTCHAENMYYSCEFSCPMTNKKRVTRIKSPVTNVCHMLHSYQGLSRTSINSASAPDAKRIVLADYTTGKEDSHAFLGRIADVVERLSRNIFDSILFTRCRSVLPTYTVVHTDDDGFQTKTIVHVGSADPGDATSETHERVRAGHMGMETDIDVCLFTRCGDVDSANLQEHFVRITNLSRLLALAPR